MLSTYHFSRVFVRNLLISGGKFKTMNDTVKNEITRQLKRVVSLTLMGALCIVSAVSVGAFSKKVRITDNEKVISIVTMNNETDKILEQSGLVLSPDDAIIRVDDSDNSIDLIIRRAFDVKVNYDGKTVPLKFSLGKVMDVINAAGITLNQSDAVSPSLDTLLEPDMEISVNRRVKISINADGRIKNYAVPEVSVEEALRLLEIPLDKQDKLNVDMEENVYSDMEITIERMGYRNKVTTTEIPFKRITKDSDLIEEGKEEIVTKGVKGEQEVVIKETISNGEIISTQEIKNKITIHPVNEVVLVGRKKKGKTVNVSTPDSSSSYVQPTKHMTSSKYGYLKDTNDGTFTDHRGNSVQYSTKLVGSCTAYTAKPGAITSTGRPAKLGNVAVNPNIIPYGSRLYITSADGSFVYGEAIAADTGGALMKGLGLVDLYMNSLQDCINFGRRTMNVYILK